MIAIADAGVVSAEFGSASTIPISANGYVATGNSVDLSLLHAPQTGATLTVVNNTSLDFITGEFSNLAQGQTIKLHYGSATYRFVANYYGGTGNDLVLQWADTAAYGWGANTEGQLGGYHLSYEMDILPVNTEGTLAGKSVVAIASGQLHSLALCADGTLLSWGTNYYGSGLLGNNQGPDSKVPQSLDRTGVLAGKTVVAISAGWLHSLALCADGTMVSWGYNAATLGNDTLTNSPVPVAVTTSGVLAGKKVTAIDSGGHHNLALCSDGTLVSWGNNPEGQLGTSDPIPYSSVPVEVDRSGILAGKTIIGIAAGGRHSMALCSDGTVAAWGQNTFGQLGNGTTLDSGVPVAVDATGVLAGKTVIAIGASGYANSSGHSMALCSDGTLATWGSNDEGELGNGGSIASSVPVDITHQGALAGKTVVSITAGNYQGYAICSDGSAVAWGYLTAGLAGTHQGANSDVPVSISTDLAGDSLKFSGFGKFNNTITGFALLSAPLTNTKLDGLVIDAGVPLSPTPTGLNAYSVAVPSGTGEITVIPTPSDPDSTVTVNGTPLPNGSVSSAIQITQPVSIITVAVTAPDGITTTSYDLAVHRSENLTANFSSPADIPLSSPVFDATGLTLDLSLTSSLPVGTELRVIDNTGLNFIRGRFSNLEQGQVVSLGNGTATYRLAADYYGGDGNDLVLRWTNRKIYMWGYGTPRPPATNEAYSTRPISFTNQGALSGKIVEKADEGRSHGLAVCTDGTLVGWGQDLSGSLGLTPAYFNDPQPFVLNLGGALDGKRVIQVQVGDWHSVALCSNGSVYTWGGNYFGQLGTNGTSSEGIPVEVNQFGALVGKSVVSISTFYATTLALCTDGSLIAWGGNYGPIPTKVITGGALKDKVVKSISRGANHSLALCMDDTLVSWGYNVADPDALNYSPANVYGQLGHGNDYSSTYPQQVDRSGALAGKTVVSAAAGRSHNVALCSDGTIVTWGYNRLGQLGDGGSTNNLSPVDISSSGALAGKIPVQIAAGEQHSYVLCQDDSIASWGENTFGELGDGTREYQTTPVSVDFSGIPAESRFTSITVGPEVNHSAGMVSSRFDDSSLSSFSVSAGTISSDFSAVKTNYIVKVPHDTGSLTLTPATSDPDSTVKIQGISVGTGTPSPPITLNPGLTQISITVTSPDSLSNTDYEVTVVRPVPFDVNYTSADMIPASYPAIDVTGMAPQISLGFIPPTGTSLTLVDVTSLGFATGRFTGLDQGQPVTLTYQGLIYHFVMDYYGGDGNDIVLRWAKNRVLSWASGSEGKLGNNTTVDSNVPVKVDSVSFLAGRTITQLAMGSSRSLALCADGGIVWWGRSLTSSATSKIPVQLASAGALVGRSVVSIASGNTTALALCSDGTVVNLGTSSSPTPAAIAGTGRSNGRDVVAISSGANHSLALCSDGTMISWGSNSSGQLGMGYANSIFSTPVSVDHSGVLAGKSVQAIAAGSNHSIALCTDGSMYAWGDNAAGQIGDNSNTRRYTPVQIDQSGVLLGKTIVAISAGATHNHARCSDGTLVSWGAGTSGQLGNGSSSSSNVPVLVDLSGTLLGKQITSVSAFGACGGVVCSDGSAFSWGAGSNGRLGNNNTSSSNVPVPVSAVNQGMGEVFGAHGVGSQSSHILAISNLWGGNNRLASFTISPTTMTPLFSPVTRDYTANSTNLLTSATVRPTLENPHAILTINGSAMPPWTYSRSVAVSPGVNDLIAEVTAPDGSVARYLITIGNASYQTWRNAVFPNSADRDNPLVGGDLASPANDGVSNIMKYALGLDPWTSAVDLLPDAGADGDYMTLTYRMNKLATDITFTVQASDSSMSESSWSKLSTVPTMQDMGSYRMMTVKDTVPKSAQSKRFLRLKITGP